MIAIFLVAILFPIQSYFSAWRRGYLEREFPAYRIIEQLRLVSDGDDLPTVRKDLGDLVPVDQALARVILAGQQITADDEVYAVAINESNARFMHFRDGVVVDHQFTEKDFQNSVLTMNIQTPPWHIRYGHWLLYSALLSCFAVFSLLVRVLRKFRNAEAVRSDSL